MTVSINGTSGIVNDATDLNYTGTLTGGTGVVNLGSGQVYKDASGNVGIGTSSPNQKLVVKTADGVGIATENAAGTQWRIAVNGDNSFSIVNSGVAERARIDSSGNLLVGTTSGASFRQRLYCNGFANNGIVIATTENASAFIYAAFKDQTDTTIGSITRVGTTSAVSYATSSDYRLKEAITPMTGALATVAALKPVTYKWKSDGSDSQGFIAHELQAVVPDCVTGEKDAVDAEGNPQYQGIDTSFLVATLAAAIQEQQTTIVSLQDTLTALTAQTSALEERLTALEAPIV